LNRIYEGNTHEHRTSSATSGLLHNYFTIDKFLITPEQTQIVSMRRPDYTIEKLHFIQFCSYVTLLEEHVITNNNGFIPLNYRIPYAVFQDINDSNNLIDYLTYISRYDIHMDKEGLTRLSAESTQNLPYPHI